MTQTVVLYLKLVVLILHRLDLRHLDLPITYIGTLSRFGPGLLDRAM